MTDWLTTPEAAFINSLCPSNAAPFPRWSTFTPREHKIAEQAFAEGFNSVRQRWYLRLTDMCRDLTQYEQSVWVAISQKTVRFSKLCEKIPRRAFVEGQTDRPDAFGFPLLPSTGLDDRALSKALKGLEAKKWIWKFESERHPYYGVSTVYSPLDLQWAMETMMEIAVSSVFSASDTRIDSFQRFFWSQAEPLVREPQYPAGPYERV